MDEILRLERAILVLEAQKDMLGEAVVEAALSSIREKLVELQLQQSTARNASIAEQRKLVTVLFADLVGFTAMSTRLDPEDTRDVINAYFKRWTTCIERYGGSVEKFIGDAVMAVFGLSTAHEDDPENAIKAALAMRDALQELNQELEHSPGLNLSMRVAIHTGPAVVSLLDERKSNDFVVVGDTINLTSRLQAVAPENGVLMTHDTYRHVRGVFSVQALELIQLKSIPDPIQAYLVHSAKPFAYRTVSRSVEGIDTSMIGRERELKSLQDTWNDVIATGQPRLVTVVGEAGVGKSRLLYEFGNWVDLLPKEIYYFRGHANASMQGMPYSLWRDVFTYRFQIQDSALPDEVFSRLKAGLLSSMEYAPLPHETGISENQAITDERVFELEMRARFIGRLLGFNLDSQGDPGLVEADEDPKQLHQRGLLYLQEYFISLTAQHPVVLILENIHWADSSSLEALHQLFRNWRNEDHAAILVVTTTRPSLFESRPQWGSGLKEEIRIDLRPLSHQESLKLVGEILQKVEPASQSIQERIIQSADGNPYYIEELVKMWVEEGIIQKGEEHWSILTSRLEETRIPPTLIELLQARMDSLPPGERIVLQRASVVGRIFWDRALESLYGPLGNQEVVLDENSQSLPPDLESLEATLEMLRSREIIFRNEPASFEGTREYRFHHALLRDVVYESLLKRLRKIYHAQVASWIERMTKSNQRADEYSALIAGHYDKAGEWLEAAGWYSRAGIWASGQFANSDAVRFLSRALELTPESDPLHRFQLLLDREQVYDRLGARQEQSEDLVEVEALANDLAKDVASLVPFSDLHRQATLRQAKAALRRSHFEFTIGNYSACASAAEFGVGLAKAAQAVDLEAEGYWQWGVAYLFESNYQQSTQYLERGLALAQSAGKIRLEGSILISLGHIAKERDEFSQANTRYEQALARMRQLKDPYGESSALGGLGSIATSRGDFQAAINHYRRAFDISHAIGNRRFESLALCNLGEAYIRMGKYRQARDSLDQALGLSQEVNDRYAAGHTLLNLGDMNVRMGNRPAARQNFEQSLRNFREVGNRIGECSILNRLGWLANERGEIDSAQEFARESLKISQEVGDRLEQTNAWIVLGDAGFHSGNWSYGVQAYRQAEIVCPSLGKEHAAIEIQAGQARIAQAMGDVDTAMLKARAVLKSCLSSGKRGSGEAKSGLPVLATIDPYRIFLTCIQIMRAAGNPDAKRLVIQAYQLLIRTADQLESQEQRQVFLNQVPSHQEIVREYQNAGEGSQPKGGA